MRKDDDIMRFINRRPNRGINERFYFMDYLCWAIWQNTQDGKNWVEHAIKFVEENPDKIIEDRNGT